MSKSDNLNIIELQEETEQLLKQLQELSDIAVHAMETDERMIDRLETALTKIHDGHCRSLEDAVKIARDALGIE